MWGRKRDCAVGEPYDRGLIGVMYVSCLHSHTESNPGPYAMVTFVDNDPPSPGRCKPCHWVRCDLRDGRQSEYEAVGVGELVCHDARSGGRSHICMSWGCQ